MASEHEGQMGRPPENELEALAVRLHHALDEMIALFFGVQGTKYGEYSTLDEALDTLAESANKLDRSLTVSTAREIRRKQGYVWERERGSDGE